MCLETWWLLLRSCTDSQGCGIIQWRLWRQTVTTNWHELPPTSLSRYNLLPFLTWHELPPTSSDITWHEFAPVLTWHDMKWIASYSYSLQDMIWNCHCFLHKMTWIWYCFLITWYKFDPFSFMTWYEFPSISYNTWHKSATASAKYDMNLLPFLTWHEFPPTSSDMTWICSHYIWHGMNLRTFPTVSPTAKFYRVKFVFLYFTTSTDIQQTSTVSLGNK